MARVAKRAVPTPLYGPEAGVVVMLSPSLEPRRHQATPQELRLEGAGEKGEVIKWLARCPGAGLGEGQGPAPGLRPGSLKDRK